MGPKQPLVTAPRKNLASVSIKNPPLVTSMYADHEEKQDFALVVMSSISGTSDFKFSLSDDGALVTVTYAWPLAMYKPEILFEGLTKTHPMVHSFISHLLQAGITENSDPPRGSITVKLPCRVHREVSEFKDCIVHADNTKLIMMRFVACHTYHRLNYCD